VDRGRSDDTLVLVADWTATGPYRGLSVTVFSVDASQRSAVRTALLSGTLDRVAQWLAAAALAPPTWKDQNHKLEVGLLADGELVIHMSRAQPGFGAKNFDEGWPPNDPIGHSTR
jgi:hypothetical protein